MAFTLDTSGVVIGDGSERWTPYGYPFTWSDLSPFEQGYVEALWASVRQLRSDAEDAAGINLDDLGFRHLAPETLAAIRKDCAAKVNENRRTFSPLRYGDSREFGEHFWVNRQAGRHADFPPLTVTLGDDGKVYAGAET